MTTTVFRIAPSGGDYASFTEFEADRGVGIPTSPASGETWFIEVESGLADNSCNITQPNADSYIHIVAASGFEHNGDQNSTTAANLSLGTIGFRITFENIIINSIGRARFTSRYKQCIFLSATRLDGGTFESCFFPARGQTRLITIQFSEGTYFKNCTMEGFSDCAIVDQRVFTVGLTFENCAFINCNEVYRDNRDLVTYPSVPDAVFDNCATDLAPIGTNHVSITTADFVDTANDNFIPAIGGALEKSGIHFGSETEVSKDVAGNERVYWDIGAFASPASINGGVPKSYLRVSSPNVTQAVTDFPVFLDLKYMAPSFWGKMKENVTRFEFTDLTEFTNSFTFFPFGSTTPTVTDGVLSIQNRGFYTNDDTVSRKIRIKIRSKSITTGNQNIVFCADTSSNYARISFGETGAQLVYVVSGTTTFKGFVPYLNGYSFTSTDFNDFVLDIEERDIKFYANDNLCTTETLPIELLGFAKHGFEGDFNAGGMDIDYFEVRPLGSEAGSLRIFNDQHIECAREIVDCKPGGLRFTKTPSIPSTLVDTPNIVSVKTVNIEISDLQFNVPQGSSGFYLFGNHTGGALVRLSIFDFGSGEFFTYSSGATLTVDGHPAQDIENYRGCNRTVFTVTVDSPSDFYRPRIGSSIDEPPVGYNDSTEGSFICHRFWITDDAGNVTLDYNFDAQSSGTTVPNLVGTGNDGVLGNFPENTNLHWLNGTGEAHFKANLSNLTDNVFSLYYDGATADYAVNETFGRNATWSKYAFVWHGNDDTESTGNFTLTAFGNVELGNFSTGLGRGTKFDGIDDYVETDASYTRDLSEPFSIGVKFPIPPTINDRHWFFGTAGQYRLGSGGGSDWRLGGTATYPQKASAKFRDNLHYFTSSSGLTGATQTFYNGDSTLHAVKTATANSSPSSTLRLGSINTTSGFITAGLDEVRVIHEELSAEYVGMEYVNQATPLSFYEISVEFANIPSGEVKETFYYSARGWFKSGTAQYNTQNGWQSFIG